MKTENINNNTNMGGKRAYIETHADIIKMETNYGVMEDRSIATDPKTQPTATAMLNDLTCLTICGVTTTKEI